MKYYYLVYAWLKYKWAENRYNTFFEETQQAVNDFKESAKQAKDRRDIFTRMICETEVEKIEMERKRFEGIKSKAFVNLENVKANYFNK